MSLGVAVSARCSPAPFERSPPGTGHIFPTAALLWALAFPTALLVIAPLKKAGPHAPSADRAENTQNTPASAAH